MQLHRIDQKFSRRSFLKSSGALTVTVATVVRLPALNQPAGAASGTPPGTADKLGDTYETHAKGIRILPGQWRPHYPWEHIAWISPAWPSQDYLWLDCPEAIFTSQGLLYLSHINPPIRAVYADWPKVPWQTVAGGLTFERPLPNGVSFGVSVTKQNDSTVALELHLKNGSPQPLRDITLQTCAFLRGIKEFADYTRDNKFVHVPAEGWIPLSWAINLPAGNSPYRVGWRTKGRPVADWPVMLTRSNQADRWVGMTWQKDTLSLIGNQHHPCMHADPRFKDLEPGEAVAIRGKLFFFEGELADFDIAKVVGA